MRLTIRSKMVLLCVIPVLLLACLLSGLAVALLQRSADEQIRDTRDTLMADRQAELEHYTQLAQSMIAPLYNASAPGDMAARDQAVRLLRQLSYGKDGYFYGYDGDSRRVFWADKDVKIGDSFRDFRDPDGVAVINELVRVGRENSHYLRYKFAMPNSDKMVPKLGYAVWLEKWNLAYGTVVNLDNVEDQVARVKATLDDRIRTLILLMLGSGAAAFILLALVAATLVKSLLSPLQNIRQRLDEIASGDGDLTQRLPVNGQDELASLAGAFNRFVEKIHGLVRHVSGMTGELNGLVSAVANQAERSEQAMNLQRQETDQVAAAINQMSAAAQEVARSAQGAAQAATAADQEGASATRIVSASVENIHALVDELRHSGGSLDQLQQDVQSIVGVLGVIRSIAEQTNLLALNAAIEAARAGEAGRGFAVVADEVRSLASNTQRSTQEIQGMIDRLQQGTANTVAAMRQSSDAGNATREQANQASGSLETIAGLIGTINAMNTQIASAAEQQTAVSEEINRSVQQIAQAVERIADETRQGTQTASSLAALSDNLNSAVRQFRI